MSIALGLGAAVAWGLADFGARFAAQRIGSFRAFFYMQVVGWAMLSGWLVFGAPGVTWDGQAVLIAALIGVANTLGGLALYRAFQIGLLSVVAPIAASSGLIILPLALVSGQKISPFQIAGLLVLITGVILTSTPLRFSRKTQEAPFNLPEKKFQGVGFALISACFFGLAFWGLGFVTPTLGGVVPVWESRMLGPILTIIIGRLIGQSLQLPGWRTVPLVVAVGVLDTGAFVLYTLGVAGPQGAVAAVISSLFSAVTVLLARLFLREKLATNQWVGVVLIFWGVVLVGTN